MKRGLVLEGGGMRALFTAGILDEMMANGIQPDGIVGVSAGATFGCNYKSNQPGRVLRYSLRFRNDPRYMGFTSLLTTGNLVNAQFSYHTLPTEFDIFDFETYNNSPIDFHIVATNVDTGKPIYKQINYMDDKQIDWLRASASLPIASRPVCIDGLRMLDGGMSDSIPLRYFQQQGYDRNIVILTQPKGFKKKQPSGIGVMRFLLRQTPVIADALANRHLMYNAELEFLDEEEKKGNTLLIYPDEELPIGRIEQNEKKIQNVYNMGREKAQKRMDEIKKFFS